MHLISINAWGGNVIDPLLDYVRAADPDILCLQEVTRAGAPSPERLFFKGHGWDLPQQADLFAAVSDCLPRHRASFHPAMQGDLFDRHGRAYRSQFGLASWVQEDIAVLETAETFVHGAFRPDEWGAPPVPRNMQALRLVAPGTQKPFVVAHLHGLRDLAGKHDTPARGVQAERVLDLIGQLRHSGEAVIFGGDLNLLPESESFALWRAAGFADLVTGRGFTDTRTALYEKDQRFADYLLVSPEVEILAFDVPAEPVVSDHRPLVLAFGV